MDGWVHSRRIKNGLDDHKESQGMAHCSCGDLDKCSPSGLGLGLTLFNIFVVTRTLTANAV